MKVVHLDGEFVGVTTDKKDDKGELVVEQLGCARKGTLNGEKIARSELLPGDEIVLGVDRFVATRK